MAKYSGRVQSHQSSILLFPSVNSIIIFIIWEKIGKSTWFVIAFSKIWWIYFLIYACTTGVDLGIFKGGGKHILRRKVAVPGHPHTVRCPVSAKMGGGACDWGHSLKSTPALHFWVIKGVLASFVVVVGIWLRWGEMLAAFEVRK